jgi:large subunit ribosomal protein L17
MKHRVVGKKLARDRGHRQALFKNLLSALILHGEIKTTEAKAKAVQRLFEKLVTKSRPGTVSVRRRVGTYLNSRQVVNRLVDEITPLLKNRTSGFTRLIRLEKRQGDNAPMVKLVLVAKPVVKEKKKKEKTIKKTVVSQKKNEKNKTNQKKGN